MSKLSPEINYGHDTGKIMLSSISQSLGQEVKILRQCNRRNTHTQINQTLLSKIKSDQVSNSSSNDRNDS